MRADVVSPVAPPSRLVGVARVVAALVVVAPFAHVHPAR